MSKYGDVVERFLKQNRANEYHLITNEVYEAMKELTKMDVDNDVIADSLRALKGHLENIDLYRDKGYVEGINTSISRSFEIIDKTLNYISGKGNNV